MFYGTIGPEGGPKEGQVVSAATFAGLPSTCVCWCESGQPWQRMPGKEKPKPPPTEEPSESFQEFAETDAWVCRALEEMDGLPVGSIEVVRRSSVKKKRF